MAMRVGLIGCGIISRAHLRGWATVADQATIAAVCDVDPDKARQAAEACGATQVATDYSELLAAPDLDAVDLCLPHHLHRRATIEALQAGKHVLCEKPIATTLADADAMIAAAAECGRTLMIAESSRFRPGVEQARELLESGAVGIPIAAHSMSAWYQGGHYMDTAWRFDVGQMGGGALIDGGIHAVDILLGLLGRPVAVSCATRRVREVFPAEDTALLTIAFDGGLLAGLTVHWSARHTPNLAAQVSGTAGTLTLHHDRIEVLQGEGEAERTTYPLERRDAFAALVGEFVDCVATGRRPRMGGPEGRLDLAVVLAAYESARSGRVVPL